MSVEDPFPGMKPFPFADLFAHGWVAGDRSSHGGEYLVACLGCRGGQKVAERPRALPDIQHTDSCPVAEYIARPDGGPERRARIHAVIHADPLAPQRRAS